MHSQKTFTDCLGWLGCLVLLWAVLLLPRPSAAVVKNWVGGSGRWDQAVHWNPGGQPQDGDEVFIQPIFSDYDDYENPVEVRYFNQAYPQAWLKSLNLGPGSGNLSYTYPASPKLILDVDHPLQTVVANIGVPAPGSLGSGTVQQSRGTFTANTINLGEGGTQGDYYLSGGTCTADEEYIGYTGRGNFYHTAGIHRVNGNLTIGQQGAGRYEMNSGLATLNTNFTYLGWEASGVFLHTAGTHHTNRDLVLGIAANGTYHFDGGYLESDRQYVGWGPHNVSEFRQGGGLNVTRSLSIGLMPGSSGLYFYESRGIAPAELLAQRIFVGYFGTGTFQQQSHLNIMDINGFINVGYQEGSIGTYLCENSNLLAINLTIGDAGTGTFSQTGGVTLLRHDLTVGAGVLGRGSCDIQDGELRAEDVYVGESGRGNVTMGGRSTASITKNLVLGFEAGSTGFFDLGGTTNLEVKDLTVGILGRGDFIQRGDSIIWSSQLNVERLFVSQFNGSIGSFELQSGDLNSMDVYIGYFTESHGTFNQTGGRHVTTGTVSLGDFSGSYGQYDLHSGICGPNNLIVGKSGTGIFNQLGILSYLETNHLKIGQFLSSSGTYNLSDGTLVAHDVEINSGGTVNQTGGSLTFGALNNTGNVNLTGGTAEVGPTTNQAGGRLNISNEASFVGDHVNYGTIKTTGATVTWGGTFTNNGTYISDPSKQTFGNLVVGPEGCIMGYSQDLFVVTGNLEVHSTQNDKWQTDQATLQFITMAIDTDTEQTNVHAFYIPGADLGPGGGAHNFRWGTLMIEEVTVHLLDGNQNNQGSALYVGHIEGLEVNENTQTIMNIYGFEGLHLYYDPFLNPDLQGMTYSLMGLNNQDGGHLAPTPVPASALLLGSGLMGLGLLGWRRKRR